TRRSIATDTLVIAFVLVAGGGCFIDPINRAPYVASISPIGTIMKNRDARLKITAYDPDSDNLTVTGAAVAGDCRSDKPAARLDDLVSGWLWTTKPAGSAAVLASTGCALPTSITARDVSCFSADKPGQYEVAMTASEAASDGNSPTLSTTVTRIFNVKPDRLP